MAASTRMDGLRVNQDLGDSLPICRDTSTLLGAMSKFSRLQM